MSRCTKTLAALAATLVLSCAETPAGPPSPPSPATPTPVPLPHPGILHGSYVLRIVPAAGCPNPMGVTFAVQLSPDDTARYPGVQGVDTLPIPLVELEVLDGGAMVRGGIGSDGGIPSAEGILTSLELIATGTVTVGSDGAGQVLEGVAAGFVEFSNTLGSCKSPAHTWSLRRP